MQPTHKTRSQIVRPSFKRTVQAQNWSSTRDAMTTYIVDEIHAYGVIRDLALAEAEKVTNVLNLERARIANDFVENAVKAGSKLYDSQRLHAGDASRQRQRCKVVKVRLSLLQAHLAAMSREHVQAA